ncbi:hypothetical protein Hanom_Chr10g00897321 [Helianthus anomalus]
MVVPGSGQFSVPNLVLLLLDLDSSQSIQSLVLFIQNRQQWGVFLESVQFQFWCGYEPRISNFGSVQVRNRCVLCLFKLQLQVSF